MAKYTANQLKILRRLRYHNSHLTIGKGVFKADAVELPLKTDGSVNFVALSNKLRAAKKRKIDRARIERANESIFRYNDKLPHGESKYKIIYVVKNTREIADFKRYMRKMERALAKGDKAKIDKAVKDILKDMKERKYISKKKRKPRFKEIDGWHKGNKTKQDNDTLRGEMIDKFNKAGGMDRLEMQYHIAFSNAAERCGFRWLQNMAADGGMDFTKFLRDMGVGIDEIYEESDDPDRLRAMIMGAIEGSKWDYLANYIHG